MFYLKVPEMRVTKKTGLYIERRHNRTKILLFSYLGNNIH